MGKSTLYFDDDKIWVTAFRGYELASWVEVPADTPGQDLALLVRQAWERFQRTEGAYEDIDWDAVTASEEPLRQAFGATHVSEDIRQVAVGSYPATRRNEPLIRLIPSEKKGQYRESGETLVLPHDADDDTFAAAIREALTVAT